METFVEHCRKGKEFRTALEDNLTHARRKFQRELDFTAYQHGHDPMYLGINGKIDYGKIWGQTSATMQSLLWPASYWRRVYFRRRDADDPDPEHRTKGLSRQASAPASSSSAKPLVRTQEEAPPTPLEPAKPTSLETGMEPLSEPSTEQYMKNRNLQPFRSLPKKATPASRVVKTPPQNADPRTIRDAVKKELLKPKFIKKKKVSPGVFFVPLEEEGAKDIKAGPRPTSNLNEPLDVEDVLAAINANGQYDGADAGREKRLAAEKEQERLRKEAMSKLGKLAVPMPDWPLHPKTGEKLDGYPFVRKWLEDEIRSLDKPYFPKTRPNEPFTFFNTLGRRNGKYKIKGQLDGNFPYKHETHRSKDFETEFIAGLARRNDYNLITNDGLPAMDQDF